VTFMSESQTLFRRFSLCWSIGRRARARLLLWTYKCRCEVELQADHHCLPRVIDRPSARLRLRVPSAANNHCTVSLPTSDNKVDINIIAGHGIRSWSSGFLLLRPFLLPQYRSTYGPSLSILDSPCNDYLLVGRLTDHYRFRPNPSIGSLPIPLPPRPHREAAPTPSLDPYRRACRLLQMSRNRQTGNPTPLTTMKPR